MEKKAKIVAIETELIRLEKQREKLDNQYSKLLWNEIKKYTTKLEDLPKAVQILNSYNYTVATFDLFSKLRNIKKELQDGKKS